MDRDMSWLGDLLKHVTISGAVTGALFLAALVLLTGPWAYPEAIEPVPADWRWLVLGVAVFCGSLLCVWAIPPVFRALVGLPAGIKKNPRLNPPKGREREFLLILASKYPSKPVLLDQFEFNDVSKLELIQICRGLREKGLLHDIGGDPEHVVLTEKGRQVVHENVPKSP